MAKFVKMVNGIPTTVNESPVSHYDEYVQVTTDIGVAGTGYNAAHTEFTLPNSKTYNGTIDQLKVEVGGIGSFEGLEYNYENSTTATKVTFSRAIPKNATVRFWIVE